MKLAGSILLLIFSIVFSAQLDVNRLGEDGFFLMPLEETGGQPHILHDLSKLKPRPESKDKKYPSGKYGTALTVTVPSVLPLPARSAGCEGWENALYPAGKRYLLFQAWLFYS